MEKDIRDKYTFEDHLAELTNISLDDDLVPHIPEKISDILPEALPSDRKFAKRANRYLSHQFKRLDKYSKNLRK